MSRPLFDDPPFADDTPLSGEAAAQWIPVVCPSCGDQPSGGCPLCSVQAAQAYIERNK